MQSPLAVNAQQEPLFWDLASDPPSVLQVLWHAESRLLYVKAIAPFTNIGPKSFMLTGRMSIMLDMLKMPPI